MIAFLKKEWMESWRTGRFLVLLLVFALLGIMNPAMAKLMPWMMETLSESLADSGITVTAVTVDAMDSWTQFYKNIPIGIIVFALLSSGSFTSEYQRGTLIPVAAKGLSRWNILLAKALTACAAWTALYGLCFGITYGYNAYFWDNGVASHLFLGASMAWLFGIWVIGLLVFFSASAKSSAQVLLGTGGIVLAVYLMGMFPRFGKYLPVACLDGLPLLQGATCPGDYSASMAAAVGMALLCLALGGVCFSRKQL